MLLLAIFASGCTSTKHLTTVVTTHAVWGQTYCFSDGVYELDVAPQIGRVMRFSRIGEQSLLWNNPTVEPVSATTWTNFGGDKLWPWPQNNGGWGWPPPLSIDRGPYRLDRLADGFRLSSVYCETTGVKAERIVRFDPSGVSHVYRLIAIKPSKRPLAAWSVVQVPSVQAVYVRLLPNSSEPVFQKMDKPLPVIERLNSRWVKVVPAYVDSKIGISGDMLAVRIGDRILTVERSSGNDDPDLDTPVAAQVYFSDATRTGIDSTTYTELELIGPSRSLMTGQCVMLETKWRILYPEEFEQLLVESW